MDIQEITTTEFYQEKNGEGYHMRYFFKKGTEVVIKDNVILIDKMLFTKSQIIKIKLY